MTGLYLLPSLNISPSFSLLPRTSFDNYLHLHSLPCNTPLFSPHFLFHNLPPSSSSSLSIPSPSLTPHPPIQILDPQSATLTLPELHAFLQSPATTSSTQQSQPNLKIGGYPTPNLRGYRTITKDLSTYIDTLAPHVKELPPLRGDDDDAGEGEGGGRWLREAVGLLSRGREEGGYGLTKGEVLMVVNLGLGMTGERGEGGEEEEEEEGAGSSDVQVLHAVVEELSDRFTDEEVEEMLRKVGEIVGEARARASRTVVS